MKKVIGGAILCAVLSMAPAITAQANSLSYIPTEETTGIPEEIFQNANIIGNEFNICPELLMALAERESCFQADAENGACKGLMQVNAKTHSQRFEDAGWNSSDWSDSYKNMYVAASYLSDLFDKYEDVGIVLGVLPWRIQGNRKGPERKSELLHKRDS